MKIVECDNTQSDYVAWFKYKVSFEEKTVRVLVAVIILCALVSIYANLQQDMRTLVVVLLALLATVGIWCLYNKTRLEREMPAFLEERGNKKTVLRFAAHGINIDREDGTSAYIPFKRIRKSREVPWHLFLFLDDDPVPVIVDKKKIETVPDSLEPYYIAKKLREQSHDYKYIRGNDLTYTGKYGKSDSSD